MYRKIILLVTTISMIIWIVACETRIPEEDNIQPVVKIFNLSESNALIASSEVEDNVTIDLVCSSQTHLDVNYYVITGNFPKKLLLSVVDQGGVFMARAVVQGAIISNVEPEDADITTTTTTDTGITTTVIQKLYSRDNPLTSGLIIFDIEPDSRGTSLVPHAVVVNGVGQDFKNNSISSSRRYLGTHTSLCRE